MLIVTIVVFTYTCLQRFAFNTIDAIHVFQDGT